MKNILVNHWRNGSVIESEVLCEHCLDEATFEDVVGTVEKIRYSNEPCDQCGQLPACNECGSTDFYQVEAQTRCAACDTILESNQSLRPTPRCSCGSSNLLESPDGFVCGDCDSVVMDFAREETNRLFNAVVLESDGTIP